jgi:hypothetical protein
MCLLDEIEEFLTGIRLGAKPDLIFATVLFTDMVDPTKQAAEMGDRNGVNCCSNTTSFVRRELARFRGREANTAGMICRPDHPLWDAHLSAGTLVGHRHRLEPLFPSFMERGCSCPCELSIEKSTRTPPGAARGCAGIRNLDEVLLIEQVCDGSVAAVAAVPAGGVATVDTAIPAGGVATVATVAGESQTKLRGRVALVRLEDASEGVGAATHGVEFRIDQFTHVSHVFSPQGLL